MKDINVSSQEGNKERTNRGESCIGVVSVGVAAARTIRLRRVLGFIGLATIDIPASELVLLGVGKVGPSGAPPAIDDR